MTMTKGGECEREVKMTRLNVFHYFKMLDIYLLIVPEYIYIHNGTYVLQCGFFTHASGHMISATDRRGRPNAR